MRAVAESDPELRGGDVHAAEPRRVHQGDRASCSRTRSTSAEMLEASLVRCVRGRGGPRVPVRHRHAAAAARPAHHDRTSTRSSQGANGLALTSYDPILDLLALLWADNVTDVNTAIMRAAHAGHPREVQGGDHERPAGPPGGAGRLAVPHDGERADQRDARQLDPREHAVHGGLVADDARLADPDAGRGGPRAVSAAITRSAYFGAPAVRHAGRRTRKSSAG